MGAAKPRHEDLAMLLTPVLKAVAARDRAGEAYGTQVQVRLGPRRQRRMPDIVFVAQERIAIVGEHEIDGAPDFIIEIVSPESLFRDLTEKRDAYEAAGVREYWAIVMENQRLAVLRRDAAGRLATESVIGEIVRSTVVPGFWVRLDWLWQWPLPKLTTVLRALGVARPPKASLRRAATTVAQARRVRPRHE